MKQSIQESSVRGQPQFLTERLQLAVFLHATGQLRFLRCERSRPGKVRFVFEDPESIGNDLELDFDRGATVSGSALFASQKFLRRKMSEALENLNIGEFVNGNSN